MLESLLNFREVAEKPYYMFLWSMLLAGVAIYMSTAVPLSIGVDSGFIAVLFTIIPSMFFITAWIKREERIEEEDIAEHVRKSFLDRNINDILALIFYFLGVTAVFTLAAFVMPQGQFGVQVDKINEIRGASGQLTASVMADKGTFFREVFSNNLEVLFFSFLFSFIFGAGAVFILVWNASILGVVIGRSATYLWQIPGVAVGYFPHGIFEIAGYVVAALAGGLMSAAVIRKHRKPVLISISLDALKLMVCAVGLILVGAVIESL